MSPSPLEQVYWGHIPVERATALFFHTGGSTRNAIYRMKYRNNPDIGEYLGQVLAGEIAESGFFEGIDAIVPVPLARMRLLKRKYNQCDWIAKGISRQTGIPVIRNAVKRIHDNRTQTSLSTEERWENTEGIFRLTNPSLIAGRHILILDDVVTTGATTISLARTLMQAGGGTRFSVIALAVAGEKTLCEPRPLPDIHLGANDSETIVVEYSSSAE
jgi:ComF family protein